MIRQRFVQDDDGHNYLINVGQEIDFENWMNYMGGLDDEDYDDTEEYDGPEFESLGTGVHNFTFTDAQEDE